MANVQWRISGEYCEACSCDSVCPCPTSGLAARPSKGHCDAGLVFRVDRGQYGSTTLDGLSFAVLLHTPGPMIQGNWTVGLILDERASAAQREALTTIASGQGGGPMAAVGPLVGRFSGAEAKPIHIDTVGHPAASRLALAKASRGHMHAFGIDWDDTSGRNNGHFAPFAWS